MPEILEAIILGIVQGLTEFLPVSSSGHLEIFKYMMGDDSVAEQSMLTTVFLHFATAIATIYVFRDDIFTIVRSSMKKGESQDFIFYIIVSMVPAVIVGFFLEDVIEQLFARNMILVGSCLLLTALLLFLSERMSSGKTKLGIFNALVIGLSQAVAILPGISRSGATISTSLLLGLNRDDAARFSFLMVVPLIFGKIAKDLLSGDFGAYMPDWSYLLAGFAAAFFTGIWACKLMIRIVKAARLYWFALYCLAAGAIAIFVGLS